MLHGSNGSDFFVVLKKMGALLRMRTSTNLHRHDHNYDAALLEEEIKLMFFTCHLGHNFRWEIREA